MTTTQQILLVFAGFFTLWQLVLSVAWVKRGGNTVTPMGPGWIAVALLIAFIVLR